ncbi:hypothetical protein YPPY54_3490, partial [Yersinia pestis PY-54]
MPIKAPLYTKQGCRSWYFATASDIFLPPAITLPSDN